MTLLGKHTFWSTVYYYICLFHWHTSDHPNKKSKEELYYGCIPHKHEYDYDNTFIECNTKLARCKHYGCYVCDPFESVARWREENAKMKKQIDELLKS